MGNLIYHGQRWTEKAKEAVLAQRNAPAIKLLLANFHDGGATARSWRDNNPDAFLIVRDVDNGAQLGDWRGLIDRSVQLFEPWLDIIDLIEYPVNEAYQEGSDLAQLAEDTVNAARYLKEGWGKDLVGGNFSRGKPQMGSLEGYPSGSHDGHWRDWEAFLPALRELKYLSVHEYGWPSMQTDEGWQCLRYRRAYNWLIREQGFTLLSVPRLIISECGIDRGGGVARTESGWQGMGVYEGIPYQEAILRYVNDLKRYSDKIAEDPYVLCAAVFILGGYTGAEGWQDFEIENVPELIDTINNYVPKNPPLTAVPDRPKPPQPALASTPGAQRDPE